MNRLLLLLLSHLVGSCLLAQDNPVNPALLKGTWSANWITCPGVAQKAYGVYHFRKTLSLDKKPASFRVHVSADNRYRLFVNGKAVCAGPARGDLYNWNFETIDLAPFLNSGENTVAAQVWNMGEYAAVAQVSNQTAFLLQGDTKAESILNTDKSWKVLQNKAYHPCSLDNGARLHSYMVIGPGDSVRAEVYPWGWERPGFADQAWTNAAVVTNPVPAGYGTDNLWTLVPRSIPLMEERLQRIPLVRKVEGLANSTTFTTGQNPLTVPANSTVRILLDQTFETIAYPELLVSGGKDAVLTLTYAEALFDKNRQKGNRNEIEGKQVIGNHDVFIADGAQNRLFRPLWLRTFRYLELDVRTKDQPITIQDLYGMFSAYPFQPKASFASNDASLQTIWDVGWRTARLCAGETYFDCPYYEQLQYEGDTRIQSLISLYVTGDDRLMRKAIRDFYNSRVPEGLTQGRYPSNRLQVIPPFSLYWVSMLYDYWMHRKDDTFLENFLTAANGVLHWYETKIDQQKGMLGPMTWWNFTDWNTSWPGGTPDGATDGNSSVVTLQYAYTLQQAAALFSYFNRKPEALHYEALAKKLLASTYAHCFDGAKGLMANTPEKKTFSQHASIMGVLTGSIPKAAAVNVMQKVLHDSSLSQATFYYRFYLTQALKKAGMADLYYAQLKPWRDMLAMGLTTFAENPEPTRSDCHAWSASPDYDFLATVCGIMPASAGFQTVLIQPALGELTEVSATMPHPAGAITVSFKRKGREGISGTITLPASLRGTFRWNGQEILLHGGTQQVTR
ncbi:alpha-L-rhamnosidase-related protein [Flavisolibacter nicotianae]|uniref:alpha-L-rhamnosidase-related protein n=1 Tax=Flavisolibacter nicotianae TaxID=2364882 RepID=UPI000EB4354D|nr:alpha-L-rhamnosidase C-terminal domain-containing protein [Flavisolibacter nicotianae]